MKIAAAGLALLLLAACGPRDRAAEPAEPETLPTPSGPPGAERLPAPEPPQNAVEK